MRAQVQQLKKKKWGWQVQHLEPDKPAHASVRRRAVRGDRCGGRGTRTLTWITLPYNAYGVKYIGLVALMAPRCTEPLDLAGTTP